MKTIERLWNRQMFRYLFFGGWTVCVNFTCFYLLMTLTDWDSSFNNGISILVALLFAYVVNTWLVFHSQCNSLSERLMEFIRFFTGRLFTMLLEFGGVYLLIRLFRVNAMLAKAVFQVIVVVLNYILSCSMIFHIRK